MRSDRHKNDPGPRRAARPSAPGVLPTPGSPISTGLFFVRRDRICITRSISVGRQTEIERVMQILSRRTKNNPVLIGEPGVGKTPGAEGLAARRGPGSFLWRSDRIVHTRSSHV